jgi:hypothetical protein
MMEVGKAIRNDEKWKWVLRDKGCEIWMRDDKCSTKD